VQAKRTYAQPHRTIFEAARNVILTAGHRITGLDEDSGLITFESAASLSDKLLWGSSGQRLSVLITSRAPDTCEVTLTGDAQNPLKPVPGQVRRLADDIFDSLDAHLAGVR
jgi:hypothetical protein